MDTIGTYRPDRAALRCFAASLVITGALTGALTGGAAASTTELTDPTTMPEVSGIVSSQNAMAIAFPQTQGDNITSHLDQLRSSGRPTDSFGMKFALPPVAQHNTTLSAGQLPGQTSEISGATVPILKSQTAPENLLGQRVGLWTAGNINLGSSGSVQLSSNGLTMGMDYQLSKRSVVGVAFGYGYGQVSICDDLSRTSGHNTAAMVYASLDAGDNRFVDMIAGYGQLGFDSRRMMQYGGISTGARQGSQIFSEIKAGYAMLARKWKLTSFGSLRSVAGQLNGFSTRTDGSGQSLSYGDQSFGASEVDLGLHGSVDHTHTFGTVSPFFNLDFHHLLNRDVATDVGYGTVTSGAAWLLNLPQAGVNQVTLGMGVNMALIGGLKVNMSYSSTFGPDTETHNVALQLSRRF